MTLREYMTSHAGEYSMAESTVVITADALDGPVGDREVEEYLVGRDPAGHQKVHLYSVAPVVHLATLVAS